MSCQHETTQLPLLFNAVQSVLHEVNLYIFLHCSFHSNKACNALYHHVDYVKTCLHSTRVCHCWFV